MHSRLLLASFLLLLGFAPSVARALELRLLSWDGEITGLHYAAGSVSVPVAAYENLLSPVYQFTGTRSLVLFRETKQDGKTIRTPVATIPLPEGLTHAILLLSAADDSRRTYTGLWIDDSPETRPAQTVTYRNLSNYNIAIRLGDEEHIVAPRSFRTLRTDTAVQRVVLKAAVQTPSGWEIIASTSQTIRPGRRTLVLLRDGRIQPNGHKDRVDFLVFNDRPAIPTPAPAP